MLGRGRQRQGGPLSRARPGLVPGVLATTPTRATVPAYATQTLDRGHDRQLPGLPPRTLLTVLTIVRTHQPPDRTSMDVDMAYVVAPGGRLCWVVAEHLHMASP